MTSRLAAIVRALKAILLTPISVLALITTAAAVVSVIWFLRARTSDVGGIRTSVDQRCERMLSDLRDHQFDDVVAQFDAALKAQLSTDQLQEGWDPLTLMMGEMTRWKLVQIQSAVGVQNRVYDLTFEHGSLLLTVAINGTGQVSGLLSCLAPENALLLSRRAPEPASETQQMGFKAM